MKKHEQVVGSKRSAWLDDNSSLLDGDVNAHLMISNNGFQAAGTAIYSLEVAKAAHKALGEFIAEREAWK